MKIFAAELAAFLRRHYPEFLEDGTYRFSTDIRVHDGEVEVDFPLLTRIPDAQPQKPATHGGGKDPLANHLPKSGSI